MNNLEKAYKDEIMYQWECLDNGRELREEDINDIVGKMLDDDELNEALCECIIYHLKGKGLYKTERELLLEKEQVCPLTRAEMWRLSNEL